MQAPDSGSLADWLDYLDRLNPQAVRLGLERIERVWKRMDMPPPGRCRVLVAGTNGKGSCVEILRRLCTANGLRVGCYTSPHLTCFTQRIVLPEGNVSEQRICAAFARIERIRGQEPLSWFEFTTLAAFDVLSGADLDVAVLEIGLGARLDAVNVLEPDVAVVTGIAMDHCHVLGRDRESIGAEKAAVYRAGKPAICGDEQPPDSLVRHIGRIGAEGVFAGADYRWQTLDRDRWLFCAQSGRQHILPRPHLPLPPCAAGLAAFDLLCPDADGAVYEQALSSACLPGRGQWLSGEPDILLDVAHNAQAVRYLADSVSRRFAGRRVHWIFGAMSDKALPELIAPVVACDAGQACWHPVVAQSAGERAASAEQLHKVIGDCGGRSAIIGNGDMKQTLHQVLAEAGRQDLVAAYGSFYTVGEVMGSLSQDCGYSPARWSVQALTPGARCG